MILTEILFVRFQEDLGITNDVGTILARKYENMQTVSGKYPRGLVLNPQGIARDTSKIF